MSHTQRNSDRRRRVLYTSALAENEVSTPASRRNALLLREARNPTAAYGARVQRRIRGRWFSLVPISRRNLLCVAVGVWSFALLLAAAHYAAVTWPSLTLESNLAVARPLRLDQPDSFGCWFMSLLLACAAGVSLLIYQLRRYRIDDFQGHYRLWRIVIVLCVIASLDSLVSVIDWSGALLDFGMGRRAALSGNDWVRIFVAIGGAVLAMRMIAEVRRSRWSLVTMILGWSLLAIPAAAKWNLFEINSILRWTLVTTAPLFGVTTLFLSLVGYLRLLYREVRRVEDSVSFSFRLQAFSGRVLNSDRDDELISSEDDEEPKRRWWHRREKTTSDDAPAKPSRAELRDAAREKAAAEKAKRAEQAAVKLAEKVAATEAAKAAKQVVASDADDKDTTEPSPKRRWFGLRAAKGNTSNPETESDSTTRASSVAAQPDDDTPTPAKKRSGLSGWFGKKQPTDADAEGTSGDAAKDANSRSQFRPQAARSSDSADDDDDTSGDDNADYSGMSKAERRRLRKLQRRGGNAA